MGGNEGIDNKSQLDLLEELGMSMNAVDLYIYKMKAIIKLSVEASLEADEDKEKQFDWISIFGILDDLVIVVEEKMDGLDWLLTQCRYKNPEYLEQLPPELRKNVKDFQERIKQ